MAEMRLQKFLARAGVASRRHAEELIAAGRVTVNGARVTEMGVKVDPAADMVAVDGAPVALPEENATFLLHKPAGYVTTMSDPQGRPTVAALMADELLAHPGLFPVGRLDTDTCGASAVHRRRAAGAPAFCTRDAMWRRRIWPWWKGCPTRATCGACARFCWMTASRCRRACVLEAPMPARPRSSSARDRCQRLPSAPRGQARPRCAGRQGVLRGSTPARGPQPPSAPHAGRRGASGDRAASRGLRPARPGESAPGHLPSARGRGSGAPQGSRPSSGAGEGLVWPMFRRPRVSEPIRVPARSATRANVDLLSGRGSQPAFL